MPKISLAALMLVCNYCLFLKSFAEQVVRNMKQFILMLNPPSFGIILDYEKDLYDRIQIVISSFYRPVSTRQIELEKNNSRF